MSTGDKDGCTEQPIKRQCCNEMIQEQTLPRDDVHSSSFQVKKTLISLRIVLPDIYFTPSCYDVSHHELGNQVCVNFTIYRTNKWLHKQGGYSI